MTITTRINVTYKASCTLLIKHPMNQAESMVIPATETYDHRINYRGTITKIELRTAIVVYCSSSWTKNLCFVRDATSVIPRPLPVTPTIKRLKTQTWVLTIPTNLSLWDYREFWRYSFHWFQLYEHLSSQTFWQTSASSPAFGSALSLWQL